MPWDPQKFVWRALLQWSGTAPVVAPRYAHTFAENLLKIIVIIRTYDSVKYIVKKKWKLWKVLWLKNITNTSSLSAKSDICFWSWLCALRLVWDGEGKTEFSSQHTLSCISKPAKSVCIKEKKNQVFICLIADLWVYLNKL